MHNSFELLNSFKDSVAIINSGGEIIFTNNAWKQFCLDNSGDLLRADLGVNYLELCNVAKGEDCALAHNAANGISKVIKGELGIFEMEYPCHSPHEKRWFILRATPVENLSGHVLLSHINITERKIAEELVKERNNQLNEINSRLSSTLFKIIHDIQGPLNSVEGLINLSKAEKNNSTNIHLSLIETSIFKLKKYIRETLKLSSMNNKIESIDFKTILDDLYKSITYWKILNEVEIRFNINQSTAFFSDKSEIVSVLSNIISNSVKYYDPQKEKPFILVSVNVSDTEAEISVEDNGIGISREFLSKIFDWNFQVNKNNAEGAGIGLNLVKMAVGVLDGRLDITSEPGVGTKVKIILPNKIKEES